MPSRASSETNSRADCFGQLVGVAVERRQNGRGGQGFGGGQSLRRSLADRRGQRRDGGLDIVGGDGDQPDVGGLGGAELLPGEEVATRSAGGHLRQQGQRNDRRGDADARLGQRERAGRPGDRDVAGADQAEPARAHVSVDGGDHRHRQLEDPAQQVRQFAGPVDGDVAGVTPRGLGEIGSRAERSAGVVEHDGPHPGLLGGVGQALVQLVDQRGGQRVAVVRRVQREPGDAALDGVVDECGSSVRAWQTE